MQDDFQSGASQKPDAAYAVIYGVINFPIGLAVHWLLTGEVTIVALTITLLCSLIISTVALFTSIGITDLFVALLFEFLVAVGMSFYDTPQDAFLQPIVVIDVDGLPVDTAVPEEPSYYLDGILVNIETIEQEDYDVTYDAPTNTYYLTTKKTQPSITHSSDHRYTVK